VVVRYSEDLSWLIKEFKDEKVIIYNKGEDNLGEFPSNVEIRKIPNVGFLGGTYLYHIANYYDQLADRTLFLQGNPYDIRLFLPLVRYKGDLESECNNIISKCKTSTIEKDYNYLNMLDWENTNYSKFNTSSSNMLEFVDKYIKYSSINQDIKVSYGAEFAVNKENILCNNIEYYQDLLGEFNVQYPIQDHFIERLWDLIFSC
jgi:hypothetical protein